MQSKKRFWETLEKKSNQKKNPVVQTIGFCFITLR